MSGIKGDFPSYISGEEGDGGLDWTDLMQTQELTPVDPGREEEAGQGQNARGEEEEEKQEEKQGRTLPFLLTVQWAVCLAAAIAFLGIRFFWPEQADAALDAAVREQVEISVKYEGYIRRQTAQVEEFEKLERRRIPADADYADIQGLRLEAREKLSAIRPQNLGQASRISGVSPADIAALMIWLHARGKDGEA